jgi:hypothetical protein
LEHQEELDEAPRVAHGDHKVEPVRCPTVVDVDEIHTPEYEKTTLHVEEEKESTQEPEQLVEDVEQTESDASRGKGPQEAEPAMESTQQGLEPEPEQEMEKEGGVPSPQGKNKLRAETSTQGMQHTQEELSIVMSKNSQ